MTACAQTCALKLEQPCTSTMTECVLFVTGMSHRATRPLILQQMLEGTTLSASMRSKHLSPVASARESAEHVYMLKLAQQLLHGEFHGLVYESIDSEPVLAPLDTRDRAMVPHIVQ